MATIKSDPPGPWDLQCRLCEITHRFRSVAEREEWMAAHTSSNPTHSQYLLGHKGVESMTTIIKVPTSATGRKQIDERIRFLEDHLAKPTPAEAAELAWLKRACAFEDQRKSIYGS